jgi:hypothetical protein
VEAAQGDEWPADKAVIQMVRIRRRQLLVADAQ